MKNLQIINIDGTEGAGKSTQISHLAIFFRSKGLKVKTNYLEDNIDSALECAGKTQIFLEENPDGLVINDGSIARMIVLDLNKGLSQQDTVEKYRSILSKHERLHHSYGMANILLILEDLDCCNARLKKESELLGYTSYKVVNPKIENHTIRGMRGFNNNMMTNNLIFHTLEVDSDHSIIEIQEGMVDCLKTVFDMKEI